MLFSNRYFDTYYNVYLSVGAFGCSLISSIFLMPSFIEINTFSNIRLTISYQMPHLFSWCLDVGCSSFGNSPRAPRSSSRSSISNCTSGQFRLTTPPCVPPPSLLFLELLQVSGIFRRVSTCASQFCFLCSNYSAYSGSSSCCSASSIFQISATLCLPYFTQLCPVTNYGVPKLSP